MTTLKIYTANGPISKPHYDRFETAFVIGLPKMQTILSETPEIRFTQLLLGETGAHLKDGNLLCDSREPELLKINHIARINSEGTFCTRIGAISKSGVVNVFDIPHFGEPNYLLLPVEVRTKHHVFTFEDMPQPAYDPITKMLIWDKTRVTGERVVIECGERDKVTMLLPFTADNEVSVYGEASRVRSINNLIKGKIILCSRIWSTNRKMSKPEDILKRCPNRYDMRLIGIDHATDKVSVYSVTVAMLKGRGPGLILLPFDPIVYDNVIPTMIQSGNTVYIISDD